ncbi:MAG: TerD family protein [Magnetococcales bacterium]|nr:TerD family protein [Magnetococcales bacterium]
MSVSLQKGQKISLTKESGVALDKVVMGLGWDVAAKKGGLLSFFAGSEDIDLDASCLQFDSSGQLLDVVWFQQLQSRDGSIQHTGDNVTGAGEGDDEQIVVELSRVPASVTSLVFVVNSFGGHTFDRVQNAYCRLQDAASQKEIAIYRLESQGSHTAMVMSKLYRHAGEWRMHAIGAYGQAKTVHDLLPIIATYI